MIFFKKPKHYWNLEKSWKICRERFENFGFMSKRIISAWIWKMV